MPQKYAFELSLCSPSKLYLRDVLDGACMHQAFIHHELPRKEDAK